MGGACLSGWLSSDSGIASGLSSENFLVVSHLDEHRSQIESKYGVQCVSSLSQIDATSSIEMVLLAVKPQVLPEILHQLAKAPFMKASQDGIEANSREIIVLSIAAGISTEVIEEALTAGTHVVRAMPNMPLQVKHGATCVCGGRFASKDDLELVNQLFSALGSSHIVDESLIDAVCAISGGGPAYVAYMIEALRDAGVSFGLDRDLAENLALETVGGTYDSIVKKGLSPEDLRKSVCSPGGTTLAALSELDKAGFASIFHSAVKAAVDRAAELKEGA